MDTIIHCNRQLFVSGPEHQTLLQQVHIFSRIEAKHNQKWQSVSWAPGIVAIDPSHKSHNALHKYPIMHLFLTEMCTRAHFCYKMLHFGIWHRCILRFVKGVYQHSCSVWCGQKHKWTVSSVLEQQTLLQLAYRFIVIWTKTQSQVGFSSIMTWAPDAIIINIQVHYDSG